MVSLPLVLTVQVSPGHRAPGHTERPERLLAVERALAPQLERVPFEPAAMDDLLRAHDWAYLERLAGPGRLDPDTYLTSTSFADACAACGALLAVQEAVLSGRARTGLALIRPPGHHALAGRGMGFCLLNHVAVAARRAQAIHGLRRLAIVDWDVHHGNGTQAIFQADPEVLYLSTHLYGPVPPFGGPFYPGTGAAEEVGVGSTVNVPLPLGAGDAAMRLAWERVLRPALERFQPELLLVSAGYDAHWADPVGMLQLSVAGFAWLTARVLEAAGELCQGRLVLSLQGGYDLPALAAGVAATIDVLLGQEPEDPLGPSPRSEPDVADLVARVRELHGLGP